ncbi:SusC/RagA family TonB-linked outer membrane protein [Aurantibacter aestuarii]|uniref:SusC/RagA family TonB-linked outer membrane protein n=1 Tax=Aurantibacter aestuarii TaxID=1266046 RepID=A0A2T1NC66_9FLAO|nr:TonB-dependent receptor [Aurantibacter aestuarii]PSG90029.1 SusC/RagA family TonB-linked outer membrane protein [Aurantibacter aestuarii]
MKSKIKILVLLLLVLSVSFGYTQNIITGTIVDQNNVPLPGANVIIKAKQKGTQTDFDGNFSIEASNGDIITFSYLGFIEQNITVASNKSYNIILKEDVSALDEVLIVGYGTQKKAILTSSVAQIKGEELSKEPVLNATQALQGKASGVQVVASDAPGQASTVIIRGLGTVQGGRDPLYVVDGILTDNINNINSSDIESINVLKDAASLAIYGNRGANGVIIVTTKKGKAGKMIINFDTYTGVRDILTRVELANASQYVTYSNEAARRDYLTDNNPTNDDSTIGFIPTNQPYDTNWLDVITQTGLVSNYNMSVSGGSERIKAFFSAGFNRERGVLLNDEFNRLTLRSNVDYEISKKLNFSHNVGVQLASGTPQNYGLFTAAYKQAPIIPVRDENDAYGSSVNINNVANPAIDASNDFKRDKNKFFKIQSAFKLDYEILQDLTFTSRFSIETEYGRFYAFRNRLGNFLAQNPFNTESSFEGDSENPANTRLTVTHTNTYRWFLDNYFTYKKTYNDAHTFNATLGITAEENRGEFLSATRNNVPLDSNLNFNLSTGDEDETQLNSGALGVVDRLYSYIARINYDYKDKYLFGASFRRDGSSKFKKGQQFGNFFALSTGWVLTEETFMENSVFDILKLRASYGELGNQNVPLNVLAATTGSGGFYAFGQNQNLQQGITITSTIEEDLTWETTEEFNVGLEFTLLDYRLSGEIDAYRRLNRNATLQLELPDIIGFDPFNSHVGEIENKGIELALNWKDNINDHLKYNIGFNVSYNKNEIAKVTNPFFNEQIGGFINNGQYTKKIAVGQPLGSFYLYDVEGIDDNGDLVYKDLNEDGVVDESDRAFFGSYLPKVYGGINLGVQYRKFDFSVDTFANFGNKVYNGKKAQRFGNENIELVEFNSRYTTGRPSNTTPRAFNDVPLSSTYYLEDGDFFRVNNITVGYTIPSTEKSFFNSIRVYATAKNPFIFQKFTGFTPELPGAPLGNAGIELDAYPTLKSFYVGLNTSF